jgi:GDP-L-fucose synthase
MQPNNAFELQGRRIWVAGHKGMVGSAVVRRLMHEHCHLITVDRRTVDLADQRSTENWLERVKPEVIFLCAARVGGIFANANRPADFIVENVAIALNVIRASARVGVKKLMNFGSSCIYPRDAPQPIREEALLTGPLESTNEWYAIAKIAGIKLCQAYRKQHGADFISVMPTNLYGPGDNYDLLASHVPAALIRRFHEAKVAQNAEVAVWGSGNQRREFLSSEDLADACVHIMKTYSGEHIINIGTGKDIAICEFAEMIAEIVGYRGQIVYDRMRPDGPQRKLLNIRRLNDLGWSAKTDLWQGLKHAYADFLTGTREAQSSGAQRCSTSFGRPDEQLVPG